MKALVQRGDSLIKPRQSQNRISGFSSENLPVEPEPSRHFNLLFTVEGSGIQGTLEERFFCKSRFGFLGFGFFGFVKTNGTNCENRNTPTVFPPFLHHSFPSYYTFRSGQGTC